MVYANPAFSEITGYTHSEIVGHSWHVLHGENTSPEAVEAIERGLRHQTEINVELINYRKDGTPFWNHLRVSPVFDADGLCTHFIGHQQDITHHKQQEAKITFQATHDLLTGLPNEASFKETLRDALAADGERGSLVAMCLGLGLGLGLDGFEPINKELGHPVGDQILMTIGQRLTALIMPKVTVARLDGDKFGLLVPGYTYRNDVIHLAEQTGQIVPLGLWILRQACAEMADFNANWERALRVAVNISSLQFIRDAFLTTSAGCSTKPAFHPNCWNWK